MMSSISDPAGCSGIDRATPDCGVQRANKFENVVVRPGHVGVFIYRSPEIDEVALDEVVRKSGLIEVAHAWDRRGPWHVFFYSEIVPTLRAFMPVVVAKYHHVMMGDWA